MHELSIVQAIVAGVTESLAQTPVKRVLRVRLRVGVLSGVEESALQFSYGLATPGTVLEGSKLEAHPLPAVIHCAPCDADFELPNIQSFRCPRCDSPSNDVRQGRELEIESLEIEDQATI